MSYNSYFSIQVIVSAIVLFLALMLILRPLPKELLGSPYHKSRRVMGFSLLILPILSIVYCFSPLREMSTDIATALNLSGYYPTVGLMNVAFLALIEKKIDLRSRRFKIYLSTFLIYPAFIIFGFHYIGVEKTLTTATTLLFSNISACLIYFYIEFHDVRKRTDSKYRSEVEIHVKWMRRSIYMLVILAIIACIAPAFFSYPKGLGLFFMLYTLFVIIYIYESYQRFLLKYHANNLAKKHKELDEKVCDEPKKTTLTPEISLQLNKQIKNWIHKKGFRESGITIVSVATEMNTNRTYLSAYINFTYDCSFKNWLTQLRVEDAKEMLKNNKELTISQIAKKSGFSSQTSFIHVFNKMEGLTPAKWRLHNKEA